MSMEGPSDTCASYTPYKYDSPAEDYIKYPPPPYIFYNQAGQQTLHPYYHQSTNGILPWIPNTPSIEACFPTQYGYNPPNPEKGKNKKKSTKFPSSTAKNPTFPACFPDQYGQHMHFEVNTARVYPSPTRYKDYNYPKTHDNIYSSALGSERELKIKDQPDNEEPGSPSNGSLDIQNDESQSGLAVYVPLYVAALKGDGESAREFLALYPEAVGHKITRNGETALHIAAGAKHTYFVQDFVENLMTTEQVAIQNKFGNSALCFAAASGIRDIAEVIVEKNPDLPHIRGSQGVTPLYMAALLGHSDMVWYLYENTKASLTHGDEVSLLTVSIRSGLFDFAKEILDHNPSTATARDGNGETALHILARKPEAFYSGSKLGYWQKLIYCCLYVKRPVETRSQANQGKRSIMDWIFHGLLSTVPSVRYIYDQKVMHFQVLELVKKLWTEVVSLNNSSISDLIAKPTRLLFTAAGLGIVEFLVVLLRMYPDFLWKVDERRRSIFHVAVENRQEKVFNLIYEIGALKDYIAAYKEDNNNNILHLAGKLAPPNQLQKDSGAALQLKRELQWFKEVEKIVQPLYIEMENSEGLTPRLLFTEEHKHLVGKGERWMKDTSASCMVVSTLIATVMFAALFTVPGGNKDETGTPMFLRRTSFNLFVISDAISLISSATSILIFLSVLTSRYAEEDFLQSLPDRLILGLATLFISIGTMMVAFGATFFIVLGHGFTGFTISVAIASFIPGCLFAWLQFPLFADIISHTYRSERLFHAGKNLLK